MKKAVYDNVLFDALAAASSHVYIFVCDMEAGITRWSQNAVEYFNMPGEYIEDMEAVWMPMIHPDDRKRYQADIDRVFAGESRRHHCEYRIRGHQGDYVWVECRGSVIADQDGAFCVFAGMVTRLDAKNKYDPLTSLRSIYAFNELDFTEGKGGILLIGIDGFREIINKYGYSFGDLLLCQFGKRMQNYCGERHQIFRLEGDEFLIVTPSDHKNDLQDLFADLRILATNLGDGSHDTVHLSLSGGAVVYPDDSVKRELLIANLEYSLKYAKAHCRGELVFYSNEITAQRNWEIQIRQELTRCISHNFEGFELYYQPLIHAETMKSGGCEALLRWTGPVSGRVPTDKVIHILEQSGEIREVGNWVLEESMKTAGRWQKLQADFHMSVNVSYLQFKEAQFPEKVIAAAGRYHVKPEQVVLELTESSRIEDFTTLERSFQKLRDHGFKISLDDFGIAYSTLLTIRNLPTDHVKIDHSFVRNLTWNNFVDQAIIESILLLCSRMKLQVVIEGVETRTVLDIIKQYPVDYYQGFYFAKPMPGPQLEELLRQKGQETRENRVAESR